MIDNFNHISTFIDNMYEPSDDLYWHLQVIKRSKDTGEGSNSKLIKAYQIDNAHPLSHYRAEIIRLCEELQARAYINLSAKSKQATAIQMLNEIADCFRKNDFNYIKRIWNSAAGKVGAVRKYWVIDCDYSDTMTDDTITELVDFIDTTCLPCDKRKVVDIVNTKNGKHIISEPFNLNQLKQTYPSIDVHKNNPTVLYIPNSIMK